MKPFVAILVLFCCYGIRAEDPKLSFCGVRYMLASVNVDKSGSGTVTNEYVPVGESINLWSTLLGIRQWPKASTVGEAINAWISNIRPVLIRDATVYKANGKENDLVVEAWLAPADRSYVEINLHRFVIEAGSPGVKAYQFAQKISTLEGRGDVSSFVKQKDSRFACLGQLNVRMRTAMNQVSNHLPDPTSPSFAPPAGAGGAPSGSADH